MNNKMMLCAVVDGDIQDLEKMIEVNVDHVRCPHIDTQPLIFSSKDCYLTPQQLYEHSITVVMKKIFFNHEMVGGVGRCSCGKIYYRE